MSLKSTIMAGLLAAFAAAPVLAADIELHHAYARASSPMAKAGAAFMVVYNKGAADDRLVGVASPVAVRVELHTHEEDASGVMKMIHVEEGFDLPAGGRVIMERGGKHVMFMGLKESFEQGKTIPLTLIFEEAGEIDFEIEVDLEREAGHGHDHSHDHES